jgi:ABC-type bacteriocin/lantibiotic exporter with double-glycine peptidase domain
MRRTKAKKKITRLTHIKNDILLLQVGKFLQLVATFIGGFGVAFFKGWLLSLVMLSCIPPVVIAGAAVAKVLSTISSKGQASYSDAGNVVEQTIGAMKTVSLVCTSIYIVASMKVLWGTRGVLGFDFLIVHQLCFWYIYKIGCIFQWAKERYQSIQ